MPNLRQELFKHKDIPWLIFSPAAENLSLSPLVELIDFYNNQLLVKSIKAEKIKLNLGEKTMFSSVGLLPTARLIVIGTGRIAELDKSQTQKLISEAEATIENLGEKKAWVVVSSRCPENLITAVKKNFNSVSVG